MTFRVGQKVVCVDDRDSALGGVWEIIPVCGRVYTVTAIGLTHKYDPDKLPCIHVAELNRKFDQPLWAHRFRPIVEPKQEQSFTHGADPSSDKWDNRVRKPVRVGS